MSRFKQDDANIAYIVGSPLLQGLTKTQRRRGGRWFRGFYWRNRDAITATCLTDDRTRRDEIAKMILGRARPATDRPGRIYVMQLGDSVKVGWTTNVVTRQKLYEATDFDVRRVFAAAKFVSQSVELAFHKSHSHLRISRRRLTEFYSVSFDDAVQLVQKYLDGLPA